MNIEITPKQRIVLDYIKERVYTPPVRIMTKQLGYSNTNSISKILKALMKKDLIVKKVNHNCGNCGAIRTTYCIRKK